jgi:phosphoglycerate kinase
MLSKKLSLSQIPHLVKGKRVLMRVDFNVPLKQAASGNYEITDTKRIESTLPTIDYCLQNGASQVVLMSHLGRPKGMPANKFSLRPVAEPLADLMQQKVDFIENCGGTEVERRIKDSSAAKVIMLENLRFHVAEEGKGEVDGKKVLATVADVGAFRAQLTRLGDMYVNDAFGTAHRAHSSMVGIDHQVRAAGFLLNKELDCFSKILETPTRPLTVVMGGAKVKDKI